MWAGLHRSRAGTLQGCPQTCELPAKTCSIECAVQHFAPRPLCVPECRVLKYNAITGTLPADLFKAHPMLEIVEVRMPMST